MKRLVYIIFALVLGVFSASANIITIDGNNIDWTNIPMLTEPGVEPIVKMIVPQDGINLPDGAAFCLMAEGQQHESMLTSYPVIYTDADKNDTTGTIPWYCPNFRYDYEMSTWSLGALYGASEDGRIREMCISQTAFDGVPFSGGIGAWISYNWGEYWLPSTPEQDEWKWSEKSYHPYNVAPYSYTDFANTHTAINAYSTHQALPPGEALAFHQSGGTHDTILWASWAVELKVPTIYNVSVNVVANNTTIALDCYLVDVSNNQVVATLSGEEFFSPQGSTVIGSWDLSSIPAGKYMLKVKNRIAWADFSLTSIAFQPEQSQYITCSEAVTICQETGTTATTETYTIRGYVTQIVYEYSSSYNDVTFWIADEIDGGQVLYVYRAHPISTTDQAVKVGDYIEIVGSLQLYNNIPEVAPGGSYTILNASAENQCGANLYWEYDGGTLTIKGEGAMFDYTRYDAPWNSYLKNITAISLSSGITTIGNYAFSDITNLAKISMPSTLLSIGKNAFYHCSSLSDITIPANVDTIVPFAFAGCSALTSINVHAKNTTYDSRNSCNAVIHTASNTLVVGCQSTIIPEDVVKIGDAAFERATFSYIEIPNTVTEIAQYAFYGCEYLTTIDLPDNLTTLGYAAFRHCYALNEVVIPSTVTQVEGSTFSGCSSLTSIVVESGNTKYDSRNSCNAIIETATNTLIAGCQNTVIPNNVTSIGSQAFYQCSSLTSITIPNNVTSIGIQAFSSCSSLTSVTVEATTPPTLGTYAFSSSPICYIPVGTLSAYQASDWAQYVGSFVEQGSTTTPASDFHNFEDASLNTQWQFIQSGQTNYWTIGTAAGSASTGSNALYITNDGSNYAYTIGSSSVSWAYIPISITENDALSFYWKGIAESCCDYLYVYLMPIGSLPTAGSTTLPEGTITLTNKLNQISEWQSFSTTGYTGDYNLCFMWRNDGSAGETPVAVDNVSIGENTPPATTTGQCGDNLFWEYNNGTLTITGTGAMYDFSDDEVPWKDFRGTITTVSLPQGLTTIGTYAFAHCRVLSSITLPNTVTIIGDYAFYDCDALINMVIPESVTTIGNNAFLYCDGLTNVTLPSGITAVEDNAFASCPSLTTITIPNGVTTIGNYAFYDCDALTTVNMPNTLITIGNYAFANCDVLSGITIPNSVTTIGNNAFYSCSALTAIHVEATTPPTIGSNLFSSAPTCYIPCGTLSVYQASDWASQVGSFEEECSDSTMITYELNGGVTNDYGWMTKNDMFQACMADAGVTGLASLDELKAAGDASFATICAGLDGTRCQYILDNEKWDWLETYIMSVQNADASATALTEGTTSAGWRYALAAFFLETKRTSWPVSADFSQAGTVQAFMPAWQHGFANPTAPTTSFVLNAPYKEGYTFGGWYTNATFSGSNITTVNASTTGTLYAKWIEGTAIPTTNAHICYGESYTWEVNGMTYTESGTYTSYADEWGMATAILNLTVAPAPIIEADSVFITENELPYIWRGYSIAGAGNYVMTEQSIHGCDSILYELYLTVEASGTSGLTYNVTVPAGTSACYIAGDMNGWNFTEMTKVNNTHFTITIEGATTDMTYKYCSGPAWDYVEKDAYGNEISARTYSTNDVVESWANIYQPLPTTPASDYHNFEDASLNAEWQFVQDGQTNYWTIGTAAGSTSGGSNALYITNDGYNYSYNNSTVSVSWAYIPVELVSTDTISFNWKGQGESSYDNMRVYLYPTGTLPTAGSANVSNDAVQVTSTYLSGQSDWQTFAAVPGMDGTFNLCFMWKNDGSAGSTPIAVDEVRVAHVSAPANPENQCGDNLYWAYSNGTLTITGSGAMYDGNDLLTYHQQSWFPDEVTRVNLPNGMTHIGATAFADCSNLTSINIPSSVVSIGEAAFAWSGLQTLTLPEGVQDIDDMVFANCSNLTKFIYRGTPYGLDNATTPMFLGCNQLDTIIAPARMWDCAEPDATVQEYYGFPSHIRYIEVTGGELSATNISYMANSNRTLLTLDISSASNTTLPVQAFASWTALETLRLPANLTEIPYQMAYACENLKAIAIPSFVAVIGDDAFRGCGKLSSIDFADSQNLYSIGQYAFAYCSALLSVEVPEGVQTLGAYAFRNTGLVQLRLPSTLSVIGNYTFYNCSHLLKMNVAAYTPPTVSSYTFYNVPRTAKVYVPESVVNTYKSTAVWREFFIESNVQDAVDNILTEGEEQTQKLLINGQVIIIRNGKSYNLMGQEL